MDTNHFWQMFEETGDIMHYLLYKEAELAAESVEKTA